MSTQPNLGQVIDWLSNEGYRILGLTLRRYGESTPKQRDFPPNFYHRDADDLLAFMDTLNISHAHILGYSDGGEVTLIAIGQQSERFQSAMVISAIGNFGPELRPIFQRKYQPTWITEKDKTLHGFPDAHAFARGWVRSMTRMVDAGGDVSLSTADRITCPLLIMLGETDDLNPEKYGQRFAERTQQGRVVMFSCGHAVHDEQPEMFRRVVSEFLGEARG